MMARIAAALIVLFSMLVPAGAVERILDFVSDATVERNGDLTVTERSRQAKEMRSAAASFATFPRPIIAGAMAAKSS
jgi:hypothetical protein